MEPRSLPAAGVPSTLRWLARSRFPAGATTVIDVASGTVTTGLGLTYYGLPVIGFAVQSYSTTGLPGVSANVLSNYGGNFNHKYLRDIR